MRVELNDDTIDAVVAQVLFQSIKSTTEFIVELRDKDVNGGLVDYEERDLADSIKQHAHLVGAYKYFTIHSEHKRLEDYVI